MHQTSSPPTSFSRPLPKEREGFTLVEVALALGVFAFAIVPIIGLMNVGLSVSKDSVDAFAITQIIRWAESQPVTSGTLYFANTGEADTSSGHSCAVYQATVSGKTTADAAQGLLARRILEIQISRANTGGSICKRTLQITQDPADLQSYFQ